MCKVLIFNFDGTSNDPEDAVQEINKSGEIEDEGITNILKFHLLLGGNLKKNNTAIVGGSGSRSFYYNGVGTYGNFFERTLNAGLATGDDVATILNRAKVDFQKYYIDEGGYDKILITGFSRGGAIARRFASLINDRVADKCMIEGIFDTVASIGLPNLNSADRPRSDVVFENGCTLPSNVEKAVHMVALDDKRRAFQPTLMNKQKGVLEVWFAGAHSDVGGGYFHDGLSDTSLRFFMAWFEDLALGMKLLTPKTIQYKHLLDDGSKYTIGSDDIQIDQNSFGVNHQQERNFIVAAITLTNRRCCVIEQDKVNDDLPLVHWSVAERIAGDRNYRPKSLENIAHQILYPDGGRKGFMGVSEHKIMSKRIFRTPEIDKSIETKVFAYKKFNHTGIFLEKDKSYAIEVIGKSRWNDGGVKLLDGKGWNRGSVELGFKEFAIAGMEPFRRVTIDGADWFTLCGSIGDDDDTAFVIGNKTTFIASKSGELCVFANDLDGYYGNNSGKLNISVSLA
ncbi:MAG: DUF2235 domain-containing protein [Mariprofundus sp.]|nr:DUF2235 domain-containing protein [Mariprofundus sp.]